MGWADKDKRVPSPMCSLVSSLSRIHIVSGGDWLTERRAGETRAALQSSSGDTLAA